MTHHFDVVLSSKQLYHIATSDASEYGWMEILVLTYSSFSCTHLSTLMWSNNCNSCNSFRILLNCFCYFFISINSFTPSFLHQQFWLDGNGANNPNGSNNVDIFSKKFLFVQLKSSSTLLDKNVNVSSSAIQTIPSVFVHCRILSLILIVLALSSVVFDSTVFLSLTTTYEVSYHITSIIFSVTHTDILHCLQFL